MASELAKKARDYVRAGAMMHPAHIKEFADALDARDRDVAELVAALCALTSIAECWESVDCRKNIQLDNSAAYQLAKNVLAKHKGGAHG